MEYDLEDKLKLSWAMIEDAVRRMCLQMDKVEYSPSTIVGVAKGGLIPAALVHQRFPLAHFVSIKASSYGEDNQQRPLVDIDAYMVRDINNDPSTLIVDDLIDTGDTRRKFGHYLPQAKFAALYLKPPPEGHFLTGSPRRGADFFGSLLPTSRWAVFPWETL